MESKVCSFKLASRISEFIVLNNTERVYIWDISCGTTPYVSFRCNLGWVCKLSTIIPAPDVAELLELVPRCITIGSCHHCTDENFSFYKGIGGSYYAEYGMSNFSVKENNPADALALAYLYYLNKKKKHSN